MERNSNHRLLLRSAIKQNNGAVGTISPVTTSPDFVLQWGNRKRLRYMKVQLMDRESNKDSTKGNDPPVSIPVQRTTAKVDRRVVRSDSNKVANQPACIYNVNGHDGNGYTNLRQHPACPAQRILRNSDMRGNSNGGGRGLASPATDNNHHHHNHKSNNYNENNNGSAVSSDNKKGGGGGGSSSGSDGKAGVWPPRFAIGLTNKEKEEDFLAIKGSKLPHRPKKRAKLIQRNLNLVSPGCWLCDLTLERYEVRENKVSRKKRRGLKDMGNVDSDSE